MYRFVTPLLQKPVLMLEFENFLIRRFTREHTFRLHGVKEAREGRVGSGGEEINKTRLLSGNNVFDPLEASPTPLPTNVQSIYITAVMEGTRHA